MTCGPPKFFYFDLGNVLLTFDHRTACEQLGKLVGLPASRIWEQMFASQLQSRYEAGAITGREMYEEFCRRCIADPQRWPEYTAFHLAHSDIFRLHVPVMPIVAQLAIAGYRLGILSNTCEEHWRHIWHGRFVALRRLFEIRVLSYEQRSSKPDRLIFEAAVAKSGVERGEVFFVDDRQENVAGALRAGLDAVLLRSPQQLAADLRRRGVRFNY